MLSTYAELHRHVEEEFDIKVSAVALPLTLMQDFVYIFGMIAYDKNFTQITYQTRRFLLLYSGQFHSNLDPYNAQIMNARDAIREQNRNQCNMAHMDETWVWRYDIIKRGCS